MLFVPDTLGEDLFRCFVLFVLQGWWIFAPCVPLCAVVIMRRRRRADAGFSPFVAIWVYGGANY